MSGRVDNNRTGPAAREAGNPSKQALNEAEKRNKASKQDEKPRRTSNQGRKESSGGDPKSHHKGS